MDALIAAAGRALAAGDPLSALNQTALRDDPPALALRGIAMAQLGDFVRAKALLRKAARAFGSKDPVSRARCIVADAEVALVAHDLNRPPHLLEAARRTLDTYGDRANAAYARGLEIRRLVLLGRLDEAERGLAGIDPSRYSQPLRTAHELLVAGIAMRRLRMKAARLALARAIRAAGQARIPALTAEVERTALLLRTPAARQIASGRERLLRLEDVEALLASNALVVDACRYAVRRGRSVISLAKRPVLFALARTLADAWPADVPREALLERAFGARCADESHRARLRVEMGRLRRVLGRLASITATKRGFALVPRGGREVVVLAWPVEEDHAPVLALLADGESWSSSALALAVGASQRTVQRALDALADAGKVQSFGRGRARRWMAPPLPGLTTALFLSARLPID